VKISLHLLENNERKMLVAIPKFNYCDVRRNADQFVGVQYLLQNLAKKGNLSSGCPVDPGFLYVRNYFLGNEAFPIFLFNQNNSEFLMNINITDENGKKPKKIVDVGFFLKYTKENSVFK
jgi:hypothetical protein